MIQKFKFLILSGICLFGLNSCSSYYNLVDYINYLHSDDDLAYYIVNYTDENGQDHSEHIVDFEMIDKTTLKVYTFSDNPDYFQYYIINAPFQIITTF